MLHLEEYRLVQWGEKSGLLRSQAEMVAGILHERLNRRLIEETLSELATLLTDADAMKQKYKLEIATEKNGPKMSPEDLPEYVARGGGAGVLGGAVSVSKRRNILNVAGLFKDMPRKMWWVVADKADFEVLVRQIGFFVQRLVDLLDHQQQEVMQNDIRLLLLNVVALNDKMDELQAIQRGVEVVVGQDNPMASSAAVKHLRMQLLDDHRDQTNGHRQLPPPYNSIYNTNYQAPQSQGQTGTGGTVSGSDQLMPPGPPAYCSGSYPTSPNSSRRNSSSGAININGGGSSLRYEYNSSGGTSPRPKSPGLLNYRRRHPLPAIDPNLISNKSGDGPRPKREVALYTQQSSSDIPTGTAELIYIEWKAINKPLRSKIRPRVENLAHLLHAPKHSSFRTLHCRGFYEDYEKGQYGFVFDRPAGAEPNKAPVSLLQMFRLKNFLPSQTQRIRLATILASALSQLHSAGWLHKSLRADNILFFPSTTAVGVPGAHKSGILLDEPYLVGYEYARFDGTSEVSEQPSSNPEHDIYRHPLAIGDCSESFNRLFDIYSLGLIFLEIAMWRPLRKIVCKVIPELGSSGTSGAGTGSRSKLKKAMAGALSSPPTPHVPLTQIMKIREWLLDPTTEDNMPGTLDFFMGQIYKDVVMRCLRGDFVDAQDGEGNQAQLDNMDEGYSDLPELEGAKVTEGFFIKVVRELERCVV